MKHFILFLAGHARPILAVESTLVVALQFMVIWQQRAHRILILKYFKSVRELREIDYNRLVALEERMERQERGF